MEMESLLPGAKVHPSLIDFYLSNAFLNDMVGKSPVTRKLLYLDQVLLERVFQQSLSVEDIFKLLFPGSSRPILQIPILFLHIDKDRRGYFGVLMDIKNKKVYVFDRLSSDPSAGAYGSWNRWDGQRYWKHLVNLLKWKQNDMNAPEVVELDWIEVRVLYNLSELAV